MKKINKREERIAQEHIRTLPTENLLKARNFIQDLLQYRKVSKLRTTYVDGPIKAVDYNKENKVYCEYKFNGTVTGRLSCAKFVAEKSMGVSLHTLTRDKKSAIRTLYAAPKGHLFIASDFSQMELRILAHISRDENLLRAFLNDIDLHSYAGSLVFNKPIEDVTNEERQISKAPGFLTVYGGSHYTLANNHNLSLDFAEHILNTWLSSFPGVPRYMDFINSYIRKNHEVYTIFGRRRRLKNITSPDKTIRKAAFRQGLNSTIQSPASDIKLVTILNIVEKIKEMNFDARVAGEVHDSVESFVRIEEWKPYVEMLNKVMVSVDRLKRDFNIDLEVPLKVDIDVGTNFGNGVKCKFDGDILINADEIEENYLRAL
jgi:DNA polymerase-1